MDYYESFRKTAKIMWNVGEMEVKFTVEIDNECL